MSAALTGSSVDQPVARPSTFRIWFQAVRFPSFTASAIPIIVGSSLALVDRSFDWLLFLAMLVASVSCHAGANMANDYFDHVKGIDTDESLTISKVIRLGYLTPGQVIRGAIAAFTVATVLGLYIVYRTGWEVLALALISLAVAVLYTGGPKPLGYVALGEAAAFLSMGVGMVVGSYFVHTGHVTTESVLLSLPIAGLVAAILHINNIRDIELDRAAGKRTLANVTGRAWANREYAALVIGAYVAIGVLVAVAPSLWPVLLALVSLPVALELIRLVGSNAGPELLSRGLRKTAGLHLRVGLLLTVGLLVRTLLDRYA